MKTSQIHITGTVQGVGFRPFINTLAQKNNLRGSVRNSSSGVDITVTGADHAVAEFIDQINSSPPPLAKIDTLTTKDLPSVSEFADFKIHPSKSLPTGTTIIPPDVSICKHCEEELFDPQNRRFQYPFITCTNCGPRYSIITTLPYDRPHTSMDRFPMCYQCRKEYENPRDRRYHAQPIGCFDCGPNISLHDQQSEIAAGKNAVNLLVEQLRQGKIAALKGVGGYHLICDAENSAAVGLLRQRKKRPKKPFAVMVHTLTQAQSLVKLNPAQEEILSSINRPILLAEKKPDSSLSALTAPDVPEIGVFLAYSPLHMLILKEFGAPLIATSANISNQPLCTNRAEINRLKPVWDICLEHDREIINGCDDSVVAIVGGRKLTFRRARGYAPANIKLPFRLKKKVLAVGANQKNTVALGFDDNAILSPHIGNLDTIDSCKYFEKTIADLQRIYNFKPDIIVCDKHPNYESTKWALRQVNENTKKPQIIRVQHHHAHILSVLIEHQITEEVLGIVFDGTGYGDDGNIWGGEFFLSSLNGSKRVGHFKEFKLLGGDLAIKEPRRAALSLLFDNYGKDALDLDCHTTRSFSAAELLALFTAHQKNLNSPLTSSCGRLFDAVASLAGICQKQSYEGQTGLMMEGYYNQETVASYSFTINANGVVDCSKMVDEILRDSDPNRIVSRFFNTLVKIIFSYYMQYKRKTVLSGGVFQNKVLTKLILGKMPNVVLPVELPANDGSIALGQIGAAMM